MNLSQIIASPLKPGIYETDEFNNVPLFAVKNNSKCSYSIVSNWLEAYQLVGKFTTNDINPKYIAEYLTNTYSVKTSPFKKIIRLPRCSTIRVYEDGKFDTNNKKPFQSDYKELSREELINLVRKKIINNLNNFFAGNKQNIGIEHSSGLDSNSILGCLLSGNKINKEIIHTYSRKKPNEIEKIIKLREFFELEKKNCHDSYYEKGLDESRECLERLGFPPVISHDIQSLRILKKNNCKYLLSGLGGDQCLSNSGKNIVNELINKGNFVLSKDWL